MAQPPDPIASARDLLERGLGELDLPIVPQQVQALLGLTELLARWAQRINLTGHRSPEGIARGLLLEAAALHAQLPPFESLADLGSGAGFPGLPLAVLRPGCAVTLVEARLRRHHFQREAVRSLGLRDVRVERGRAEVLPPRAHAAAIAQAVAPPERVLPWLLPWTQPGGLVLLPRSDPAPEVSEIEGVRFEVERVYRVPCGGPARRLWIGRRCCDT